MILTPRMLLTLATLCAADYEPTPAGTVIDAGNDIRAVLEPIGEYLVVSVRGTVITDVENWLTDFDAFPAFHVAVGYAPRGFLDAALALLPLLEPHIQGRRVIVCGHSLGGAVAALLAALMVRIGWAVEAYAAFEPAHSMRDEGVQALGGTEGYVSRFGNDPVPPEPPLYLHPCAVTRIGRDMLDAFACHSIVGVAAWLREAAREPVAA